MCIRRRKNTNCRPRAATSIVFTEDYWGEVGLGDRQGVREITFASILVLPHRKPNIVCWQWAHLQAVTTAGCRVNGALGIKDSDIIIKRLRVTINTEPFSNVGVARNCSLSCHLEIETRANGER